MGGVNSPRPGWIKAVERESAHPSYRGNYCEPELDTIFALAGEVGRARDKFPSNRHLTHALIEEVGELAQAQLQNRSRDEIRREAIQVACVALRIFEEGDPDFVLIPEGTKL